MKQMLIITGPQGSGNHVFSKVFALHDKVFGWSSLNETYWEGHQYEPFYQHWHDPKLLSEFDWTQSDYYVTSISCPYVYDGEQTIPDYTSFIQEATKHCDVQLAIIGRDQNILEMQQTRVRGEHTTPYLTSLLYKYHPTIFLSQELLYLYKEKYLQSVAKQLDWPVAWWNEELDNILKEDANKKYINPVKEHWLDKEVKKAIKDSNKC
jgi:hypothetical protein